jgi:hypothetical protein
MNKPTERTLFPLPESARPETRMRPRDGFTYSAASMFQTCRRRYRYRHVDHLVPVDKPHALRFGTVTHQWLEVWHRTRSLTAAQEVSDDAYANRAGDRDEKRDWHAQTAMLKAYAALYENEPFEVVDLECEFSGPLRNPAPGGRRSRSFQVRGKIDGIVRRGEEFLLLEHKTAASVSGDYIERLAMDLQILLYSYYARESLEYPVTSIIYNVLVKPRLAQAEGETEEQFEARKAELEAKSKTGKPSTAKRKLPETDEEFQARLADWFVAEPRFTRVELILDFDAVANVRQMLWEISKEILDARRQERWHQNPRACFGFGKCAYWPICSSKGNELVIENLFTKRPPNEELSSDEEPEPAF